MVPYTRQYYSIIFYHDLKQKNAAITSYEKRNKEYPSTVSTEIMPYTAFYRAEDYHQKYYLQQDNTLMKGISGIYTSFREFVDSTAAARLNGYVGGNGDKQVLSRDLDLYGLTVEGKMRLLDIAAKGINPVCGIPEITSELIK